MSAERLTWEEAVIWLKQQPDQAELVRACFFDDPLPAAAERYHGSSEWKAVREWLPDTPGRALDVGAGLGISSYALARDGWQTVALEPDGSRIVGAGAIRALAEETRFQIDVEQNWGEDLPFADASFDLVHCRQVLHHARNLGQLCREIGRVLKPGAAFIATREHVISRAGDLPAFLAQHPLHHLYEGECAYLLGDYISAIQDGGIHLCHVVNPYASDINLYPETMVSLKRTLARKLHWLWPSLIPDSVLVWLGARCRTPGCLYSFVGRKADGG